MPNYVLSPMAVEELRSIWDLTSDTWGEAQADLYTSSLHERCSWLAINPLTGRERKDLLKGLRCFPEGMHMVYYNIVDENLIEILRFVHQKQDVVRLF